MNLVTPKAGAKSELLIKKVSLGSDPEAYLLSNNSSIAEITGVIKFITIIAMN